MCLGSALPSPTYFSTSLVMKATSSVPSGGVRSERVSKGRKSAQARLSPSGNTTANFSRLATCGHEVCVAISSPVWALPCSTMTSGAGLLAGSCALKVRATPPTLMLSASTGLAQHSIDATAAVRNFLGMGFIRRGRRAMGAWRSLFYKGFQSLSEFCSRNGIAQLELVQRADTEEDTMKLAIALAAAAGLALAIPA